MVCCDAVASLSVLRLVLDNHVVFYFRTETIGYRAFAGDEHPFPVLVFFLERKLQQEDVRRVQGARMGGRRRRIQVRVIVQKISELCPFCFSLASFHEKYSALKVEICSNNF